MIGFAAGLSTVDFVCVKFCNVHGGISVGEDDTSHQCCEDKFQVAVYIGFSRFATLVFHDENFKFEIVKSELVHDSKNISIIANEIFVTEALNAAELLQADGISARVINMATIKPLDEELVLKAARGCGKISRVRQTNRC